MFSKSPVKRYQREMIAVVVSVANNCEYCQIHHAEALNHYWKSDAKIKQLKTDFLEADISESDKVLCQHAKDLTLKPADDNEKRISLLREEGFDDRFILDITLIISYFNFVNRIVHSLGVDLEEKPGGYNY